MKSRSVLERIASFQPRAHASSSEERTSGNGSHNGSERARAACSSAGSSPSRAGDEMMIAHVSLREGCIVPKHEHANEQLTYILEGCLRFVLGDDEGETVDVAAGEVLHIPSHLPHSALALEDTLDVDIFHPPRR